MVGLNERRGLQWDATAELEKAPCGLGDVGAGWEDGRELGGPLVLDSGLSVHPPLLSKSHVELGKSSNSRSIFPEKWLNGLPVDVLSDVRGSLPPPLPLPLPPPPLPPPPVLKAIEFEDVGVVAIPRALIPLT